MASPKLAPGEHILVNVTATMRAMLFPTLELLLITGLGWMIIGYFGSHSHLRRNLACKPD